MQQLESYPASSELQLRDVLGILWRRKWVIVIVFGLIASLGAAFARIRKERFDATAQMIVTPRGTALGTVTETSASTQLNTMLESPQTQIGMIMSDGMAQRTLDQLKNDALLTGKPFSSIGVTNPSEFRVVFAETVKVTNPLDTNLLEVTVTQSDPQRAATWANAVCQAFIQWKKDLALQTVQDIANNLQKRVTRARDQMIASERDETAFKQHHDLVDVPSQQKAALDEYLLRESEAETLQHDLVAQQQRLKALEARLAETNRAIRGATGVRDEALVKALQTQLSELRMKRAADELKYTPEYPNGLGDLDKQIEYVNARLTETVQGTVDNKKPSLEAQGMLTEEYKQAQVAAVTAQAKYNAVTADRDQLKRKLANLPATLLEYTRLARKADLSRQSYSSLQLSLNGALLNEDTATGNVQVTQAAFPPVQSSSMPLLRLIIIVVVLGLLMAVGAALLVERADHRIRTVDQVRSLLGGQVVGVLPSFSRRQMARLKHGHTPPEVIEAYGLTRANLALAIRGATEADPWQQQIILITSALPGEGKSVTAAELARSIARSGKSVILVDADTRRPTQHILFSPTTNLGLVDVLTGQATLEAALGAPVTANLSVLQSGTFAYNPTEMLSQPRMAQTLARLREMANVVIVDAPACALVADALLLAPHADCILQVIGTGQADESLVRDTTAALQAAAPKTLAFFVNRAPRQRMRRYRSYYHHTAMTNGNGTHAPAGDREALASLPGTQQEKSDRIAKK